MANTFFRGSDGVDLGKKYVTTEYLFSRYPDIDPSRKAPGLYAWGNNTRGGLGLGDTVNMSSPVQVGSLRDWKDVAPGQHTLAVKQNGSLWAFGEGQLGQLGLGQTFTSRSSPVQVGTLTDWSSVYNNGSDSSFAIKTNGTLWAWGWNNSGQLGLGDANSRSSPVQVGTLNDWAQLDVSASSEITTLAIKTNGTLWAWGNGRYGKLGLGDIVHRSSPVQVGSLTNWYQISQGFQHCAAIKTDGTLWTWGRNINGQLGLSDTTDRSSPVQVGNLTDWYQISLGDNHFLAIKTDGTLWACGSNHGGSSPVRVGSLTGWKYAKASGSSSYVIGKDGSLWAWGSNSYGQLGLNNTTDVFFSPVKVGSTNNWFAIRGGFGAAIGINDGGY